MAHNHIKVARIAEELRIKKLVKEGKPVPKESPIIADRVCYPASPLLVERGWEFFLNHLAETEQYKGRIG